MGLRLSLLLGAILCTSFSALAVKIQILHTNDLHSYQEHIGSDPSKGGFAKIKAVFDQYRHWGEENGIKTFVFDGGDFLEGNILYKAQNGVKTIEGLSMMGFDAMVLGNHDYLMGARDLDALLAKTAPTFPILAANFEMPESFENIHRHISPSKEFEVEGVRFAVLGLTTDSKLFSWCVPEGEIQSPLSVGKKLAKELKKKNDFVFALTHIGVNADKSLVASTKNIDLVIGGHSHTLLEEPLYALNRRLQQVPIVQTGEHGERVGRMIVELEKGMPLKILQYEMIEVSQQKADAQLEQLVGEARHIVNDLYGADWLNEEIGYSKVPLTHSKKGTTFWGDFIADATREFVGADIGIHTVGFIGHDYDAGPITREKIIGAYPRFFEFNRDYGWNIYLAKISGPMLKLALEIIINTGAPVNISGLSFTITSDKGMSSIEDLKVALKDVDLFRVYTVAIPEGIARGGPFVTGLYPYILGETRDSGKQIWAAIEDKVKRTGTLELNSIDRFFPRMMIPENLNGKFFY